MEKTLISIGGMHCASCAVSIEKALKKKDGVQDASVNLAAERASVLFDPQLVVLSDLRDVIEGVGFEVKSDTPASGGLDDEEGLEELRAFDVALDLGAIRFGKIEKEGVVVVFLLAQGALRLHVDGLVFGTGLVLGRTHLNTERTTRTIFGCDLNGEFVAFEVRSFEVRALEGFGGVVEVFGVVHLGPNGCVRTDKGALVALNTDARIPNRNLQRQVTLLPLGGSDGPRSINRKSADRKLISLVRQHHPNHISNKFRRHIGDGGRHRDLGGGLRRHLNFMHVSYGVIHCSKVALHDLHASLGIGLLDGLFDLVDRFAALQYA